MSPGNRPSICTPDGLNCIAFTSRLHFDAGGYGYDPNTASTVPQHLDLGLNARRARIGVLGTFMGDWSYALIYDFGGSSDGFGGLANATIASGGTVATTHASGWRHIRNSDGPHRLHRLETLWYQCGRRDRLSGRALDAGPCHELQRHHVLGAATSSTSPTTSPRATSALRLAVAGGVIGAGRAAIGGSAPTSLGRLRGSPRRSALGP